MPRAVWYNSVAPDAFGRLGLPSATARTRGSRFVSDGPRYRLDDLRRLASALGSGAGLAPTRASALAGHLLWFDAAGARPFGIATLPRWLDRLELGRDDPNAEGWIRQERAAVAVLDGRRGPAPLVLGRAAGLAIEKARDVGVGLIRVSGLGPAGPAAPIAAEVAIGPELAVVLGPGPSVALALPAPEGLPVVFDSALAGEGASLGSISPPEALTALVAPWSALVPEEGWLIVAVAVTAMEPLATFHERVADAIRGLDESPGRLLPGPWEARRAEARRLGVALDPSTFDTLRDRAGRLGVEMPRPCEHQPG